jgi:hypothetical protein
MLNRRLFHATQGPVKTAQCSYLFPILSAQDIPHPTEVKASISAMSERDRSGRFWVTAKAAAGGQKVTFDSRGGQNKLRTPRLIWPELGDGNYRCAFQNAHQFGNDGLRLFPASLSSFGERKVRESGIPKIFNLFSFSALDLLFPSSAWHRGVG